MHSHAHIYIWLVVFYSAVFCCADALAIQDRVCVLAQRLRILLHFAVVPVMFICCLYTFACTHMHLAHGILQCCVLLCRCAGGPGQSPCLGAAVTHPGLPSSLHAAPLPWRQSPLRQDAATPACPAHSQCQSSGAFFVPDLGWVNSVEWPCPWDDPLMQEENSDVLVCDWNSGLTWSVAGTVLT